MTEGCFIGIDQGSTATKAVVIGATGQIIFQTRRELSPPFREGDRIEHDPLEILQSIRQVLGESLQAVRGPGVPALGIGLSCQRSSCLVWDEPTGKPLTPVISWRDMRGSGLVQSLSGRAADIFTASGLPLTPYYSASKFRWLRDNVPAAREAGAVWGTLSSFLVQRLTDGKNAVIDHTNAARTQLMNIRSLAWDEELLGLFGLAGIRLPGIVPTAYRFGTIADPSGNIPLLACIGDQQSAMLGVGVVNKRDGGINYGTGGFLMVNTGAELVPAEGLMASVHYSSERERSYLLEGSVNAVGDALEWARTRLGLFREYTEVDDLCWKAASDVTAFIGLNGTGAPYWEADISSSFHGLTPVSSSADMVRAVVEGIAFFMREIVERIKSANIEPASFALSGGPAAISYLVQFQADVLGRDVQVNAVQEASALGAALLAGMQHGTWTAAQIKPLASLGEIVKGERNPGAERRHRRWKELHRMTRELDGMNG